MSCEIEELTLESILTLREEVDDSFGKLTLVPFGLDNGTLELDPEPRREVDNTFGKLNLLSFGTEDLTLELNLELRDEPILLPFGTDN